MALSPEETAQARVAYSEIRGWEMRKAAWFFYVAAVLFLASNFHGSLFQHEIWCVFPVFYFVLFVYILRINRRLKARYPANLKLLAALREREGGSLAVEDKILHYPPLLNSWNKRLEKRSILWRLDRFLSGGSSALSGGGGSSAR